VETYLDKYFPSLTSSKFKFLLHILKIGHLSCISRTSFPNWISNILCNVSFIWEIFGSESVEVEDSRLWGDSSVAGRVVSVVLKDRIFLVLKVQVTHESGISWTSRSLKIKSVQAVKQHEPLAQ